MIAVIASQSSREQTALRNAGASKLVQSWIERDSPLLLPTAAKRPIKLHIIEHLVQFGLRQGEFGRVVARVRVQDFQIARCSASISQIGEAAGVLRRFRERILLLAKILVLRVSDERVRDLPKRLLNRLLVYERRLLLLCLGQAYIAFQGSSGKERLRELPCEAPRTRRPRKQLRE